MSVALHCLYIKNFILLKSGDIESNAGPRKSSALKFSLNLNGLAAYEFTKLEEGTKKVTKMSMILIAYVYQKFFLILPYLLMTTGEAFLVIQ